MNITWYGHSCFKIDDGASSVVFDPYSPGSVPGLTLPELTADTFFCSHGHDDHCYSLGVKLTGRTPDFTCRRFRTFHDGQLGAKRGSNTVTLIDMGGMRILHMGDIGHPLPDELVRELEHVDVLMVPVGGYYTIDARQAFEMKQLIDPRVTLPMHYRGPGFGYEVLAPVDDFAALCGDAEYFGSNILQPDKLSGKVTAVLKCPVSK